MAGGSGGLRQGPRVAEVRSPEPGAGEERPVVAPAGKTQLPWGGNASDKNHRMVGVGRALCGSPSPTPCRSRVTYSRLQRTLSRWLDKNVYRWGGRWSGCTFHASRSCSSWERVMRQARQLGCIFCFECSWKGPLLSEIVFKNIYSNCIFIFLQGTLSRRIAPLLPSSQHLSEQ